jgi:hypothetical protein
MPISDWSAATLCTDADLVEKESTVLQWTRRQGDCKKWRDLAKEHIGDKLRFALKQVEIDTDADEVLDLIADYTVLKKVAVSYTLYLIANDVMTSPEDYYSAKAAHYLQLYRDEWDECAGMISLDTDEDGSISDSEKYNMRTGVKFNRST